MKTILPLLLILLCFVPISQTAIANDMMIVDLDSSNPAEFSSQAASWTLSTSVCPTCHHAYTTPTECFSGSTYQVLGGPNALGLSGKKATNEYYTKEYPAMETFPTFAVLLIDVSLFSDTAGLTATYAGILDITINGKGSSGGSYSGLTCSTASVDSQGVTIANLLKFPNSKFRYDLSSISASQAGKGVTLKITNFWQYTTTQRSIGLSNIRLYMFRDASQYNENTNFPCGYNFYWDNDLGCTACHPSCKICTGTTNGKCTSCNSGYYKYANTTCLATCVAPFVISSTSCNKICTTTAQPYYLEYTKTCSATCDSPLIISGSDGLCSLPCGADKYQYPDGSCQIDCPTPMQQGTTFGGYIKTCTSACADYLYSDGSCQTDCPAPLLTKSTGGLKSCYNPCSSTSNYLYPDSSCISNCPYPFVTESGVNGKYCKNPCGTDYIAPDYISCVSQCESPLKVVSPGGILVCVNPCSGYLYPDDSCLAACESSMEIKTTAGVKYCQNPCSGYVYPDNSCLSECDSPLVSDQVGFIQYCKSSCTDANDYLYPDNSCLVDCEIPLIAEETGGLQFCKNSCSGYLYPDNSCVDVCESPLEIENIAGIQYCKNLCTDYLYPDNSCFTECESPMTIKNIAGVQYCKNPCNDFTYPDGSCLTECESPLIVETEVGVKNCKSPCSDVDDFIYADGSCDETCPMLLSEKTESGIKYCFNPCKESGAYLASNQECQTACPSPSTIKTESVTKFCVFPCENLNDYYYEETGKCQATCNSPFKAVDSPLPKICKASSDPKPTLLTPTKSVEKIINATNSGNSALSAGVFAFTILNPLDSTLSLIGSFSKMLQYVKYMKIDYPEKVQIMFKEQSDSFQDFPNKMAPELLKKFPEHELPERFMVHNTSSSFFVNFWSTVFKLAVILLVSLVVILIAIQRKKNGKPVQGSLKVLLDCLKWNLFITYFCSNIGDGVFYTALEMRTLHLSSTVEVISFLLCIAANAGSIYIMFLILNITWTIRKSKKKVTPLEGEKKEPEKNWASCQTLFAPYQERWYYQHIYLFLFLVRVGLFNAMLGYLFDYPLLQASAFVLCGILMLAFLLIKRPIKDKISLVMEIIFEVVLLPYNLCVLVLAVMDRQGVESQDHRNRLGDLLIYINLIAPYLAIAMTATKAFLICLDFYKEYQAEKVIKVMKGNFKAIHPEIVLNASQSPSITKISPSSSLFDKNLIGNSQKIDLDEEPSSALSPGRSLIAENQRRRLSSVLVKTKKGYGSTLVFPDNMSTSPGISPIKVDSGSLSSSKSPTPPLEEKRILLVGKGRFFGKKEIIEEKVFE